jgi:hypothetical protein
VKYYTYMENSTSPYSLSFLANLPDSHLEDLEDYCVRKGLDEAHDLVLAEMHRRPNFVPSTYSLQFLLEDLFGPIQFEN